MLEINLLPVREAKRKADIRQQVMQLVFVLMVTAGGIGIVQSWISDQLNGARTRVNQMENDIKKFKPQLDQVAAFRKQKIELENKIDIIDGLDRARSGPVRVLSELATRTPDRLWLTDIKTKGTSIELKGMSLDNELVAMFLKGLNESPYFDQVDLNSTLLGSPKDGLKLVKFSINAVVVNRAADEVVKG